MKKRFSALFLAFLMLAGTACSNHGSKETPKETPDEKPETPAAVEEFDVSDLQDEKEMDVDGIIAQRSRISDNLPEMDFAGQAFRFLSQDNHVGHFFVAEFTGEATNDAIFSRNRLVEDRYNVVISADAPNGNETEPILTNMIAAGDDEYELVDQSQFRAYHAISKGSYLNWLDIPHINGEMPWWNTESNNNATINGKLFCITGDLCISGLMNTYCIYFNHTLLENHGYPVDGMYDTVREGKWTIDTMRSMTETIFEDLNGDGQSNFGDVLGFSYFGAEGCDVWVDAAGEHITQFVDGKIVITMGTERVFNLLEKVVNLAEHTTGAFHFGDENEAMQELVAGHVTFMPIEFKHNFSYLRDAVDPYGMLPFPKYDEAQEKYYTIAQDQFAVLGIPVTLPAGRYDLLGVITEALCAESYKTVYPAFYNVALKDKYSQDPSTAEMIDLIMENRQDEFIFQFGEAAARLPYWFRDQMYAGKTNLASYMKSNTKSAETYLEEIYTYYE